MQSLATGTRRDAALLLVFVLAGGRVSGGGPSVAGDDARRGRRRLLVAVVVALLRAGGTARSGSFPCSTKGTHVSLGLRIVLSCTKGASHSNTPLVLHNFL